MIRVEILATGPRAERKTYILERIANEVRRLQSEFPGKLDYVLIEKDTDRNDARISL